ncbi:MAG: MarR family winged helix-turn-helix transcriptional regulator [Sphingomonas adhaesiva]|uniref:MarR family winged helix-turn-helix transcriptional regulator n=1 Tax=Sphingomonas adhaesiva TaxID=28212 RepID=UPI002FF4B5E0
MVVSFYDPSNFFPDTSVGYLIRVCNQLGMARLDQAFADEGVTAVQWSALIGIHLAPAPTCAALARDMAHDKGAMTRMIDALEAKGWVVRARDDGDRRIVNLALTAEGEAAAMRCRARAIDCWNALFADWSHAEIHTFIAQLQRLRRTLESAPSCAA